MSLDEGCRSQRVLKLKLNIFSIPRLPDLRSPVCRATGIVLHTKFYENLNHQRAGVVGPAQRKVALTPDQKRGPMPSRLDIGAVERVELGGGHANVESATRDPKHVLADLA